jgi:transcriptional regulator of acetoin/glycerol metabolism
MTHAGIIDIEHLPEEILHPTANDEQPLPKGVMSLRDSEKVAIEKALEFTQNNVIKAANILGISKSTLYRKLKEYDMDNFEEKSF